MNWRAAAAVLIVGSACVAGTGCSTQPPSNTVTETPRLLLSTEPFESGAVRTNYWRAQAKLQPVKAEPSALAAGHARYLVENRISSPHDAFIEDPAKPWYQPQFAWGPVNNLILLTDRIPQDGRTVVDTWLTDPYTALNLLGTEANRAGYGSYCKGGKCALVIQIYYDPSAAVPHSPAQKVFPFEFPPAGAVLPATMTAYWGKQSDPPLPLGPASLSIRFLANCPGYTLPTGPAIIFEIGPETLSDHIPLINGDSLMRGSQPVDHCLVNWWNYDNSHGRLGYLVRRLMGIYQTVILVPRQPLRAGASYTAHITVDDKQYQWTFSTEPTIKRVMPQTR